MFIGSEDMKRTSLQNRSLHLGFRLIKDALNLAGLDMRKVLKPHIAIPWSEKSVKEFLFRPVMETMTQKKSTTELEKIGEINEVWDVVMRFLGENHGVEYIPFPVDTEKQKEELGGYKTNAGEAKGYAYPEYIGVLKGLD